MVVLVDEENEPRQIRVCLEGIDAAESVGPRDATVVALENGCLEGMSNHPATGQFSCGGLNRLS